MRNVKTYVSRLVGEPVAHQLDSRKGHPVRAGPFPAVLRDEVDYKERIV